MDMVLGPPKRYDLSGDPLGDKPLKPVLLLQLPKPVCRQKDVPRSWSQIEQEQDVAKGLPASVIKKQGILLTSKSPSRKPLFSPPPKATGFGGGLRADSCNALVGGLLSEGFQSSTTFFVVALFGETSTSLSN